MLLKRSATLNTHLETCMDKCGFNNATRSRSKTYYPAIKEMFAIPALSVLSDNVTLFTSLSAIKRENYIVVSIHLVDLFLYIGNILDG